MGMVWFVLLVLSLVYRSSMCFLSEVILVYAFFKTQINTDDVSRVTWYIRMCHIDPHVRLTVTLSRFIP
jgi:hypothetical protein